MKKAVQFGGGNIGRGFSGELFSEAGYEVVFIDVVDSLVDLLNERKSYAIRIACDNPYDIIVKNVRAVNGNNISAVADEIKDADIACTAVGVNVLKYIAPAIAAGIIARYEAGVAKYLNIIICENLQGAQDILKEHVKNILDAKYHEYFENNIAFVMSVVGRMVPVMTAEQKAEDPLLVIVEPYKHLPIDKEAIKGDWSHIEGIEPASGFQGYVDRKLYTHNAGHAVSAYLGYLKNYEFIYQAMNDPEVKSAVKAALAETGEALINKHGFNPIQHQEHIDDLLNRFANVALGDTIARVGRDPMRKLSHSDRLIGGANLCLEYEVNPVNMCKAIAAALKFNPPGDPTAPKIQQMIAEKGIAETLLKVSEIPIDSVITREVIRQYECL